MPSLLAFALLLAPAAPFHALRPAPAAPRTVLEVGRPDVFVSDRSSTRSTDWRSECDTDNGATRTDWRSECGQRVGTISNSFGMNRKLAGLEVGLSDELSPPRPQIVVEITERPATSGLCDWICGACGKLHQDPTQPPEFFHGDLSGHRCNACRAPLNLSILALHATQ